MYKQSSKFLFASSLALTIATLSNTAVAEIMSQDITNARQETQIWTTYALSPYLRSHDIKVSVQNGKATLTGKVDGGVNKDLAEQIALGVNGIKEADNQLVIQADYVAPKQSSDRSYGDVIDDATITATVKFKLLWSKYTDGLAVNVDTMSGKVTLKGSAESAVAKELAGRLTLNTHGVLAVDNQLIVVQSKSIPGDKSTGSNQEIGQGIADSWITTKVKSTFMYSSNVNSSNISVSTNSGVVTLSGKVDSGAERALAIEFAQNIRGVKSVNSIELLI